VNIHQQLFTLVLVPVWLDMHNNNLLIAPISASHCLRVVPAQILVLFAVLGEVDIPVWGDCGDNRHVIGVPSMHKVDEISWASLREVAFLASVVGEEISLGLRGRPARREDPLFAEYTVGPSPFPSATR
jgi:hypothetical protein